MVFAARAAVGVKVTMLPGPHELELGGSLFQLKVPVTGLPAVLTTSPEAVA